MRNLITILFSGALIFFAGCASYQGSSLSRLDPSIAAHSTEIDGVTVAARLLDEGDSKKYLDRDVLAKGYQPVQLSIQNSTDSYVVFSPDRVSLPCANPDDVAKTVHTNTALRVVAWGVPGIFIWPLLIPAVVDGIGSSNANKELDADFSAKAIKEVVIQPSSLHEGLLFIPSESFTESFEVSLMDRDTKEMRVFSVTTR